MSRRSPRPSVHRVRLSRLTGGDRRHLLVAALVVALVCSAAAALVPGSTAAFTVRVTNTANTAATAPYFTCAAAITASSPRVYYKLDEPGTATTAVDSSGQARNGTYQGTATRGVGSACGRDGGSAVTFNGTSGYVDLPTSLSVPTTYSVSAWFKTTSTSGGLIAGFGAAATAGSLTVDRVLYLTDTGALVFGVNSQTKNTITAAGPYRNGQWHHVLATVGPSGMRLYVDGSQAATGTSSATAAYTGYFRVGYDNLAGWPSAPTSSFLLGTLDEVAAYSTTLTATDAASQYRAGI